MTARPLAGLAVALAVLVACGGTGTPPAPQPPPAEAPPLGDADPAQLQAKAETRYALVPSPSETQAALSAAGLDTQLAELVPADRAFRLEASDADRVAVRTGVVIADMLLTARTSSPEMLTAQLTAIRAGMSALGGGPDVDATLGELLQRLEVGGLDREALVKELEEISQVGIPELEFNGIARVVPLVQAGSWLAGANLVARAALAKGTTQGVDGILKQPAVVQYFAGYAKEKVPEGAPAEIAGALDATLARLGAVATKAEPLTADDLQVVVDATQSVLVLL